MASSIDKLVTYGVGLLVLVVVIQLGPGIGQEIETSLPINESGSYADATTGADIWNSGTSIMSVVILIVIVSLGIAALYNMKKQGE